MQSEEHLDRRSYNYDKNKFKRKNLLGFLKKNEVSECANNFTNFKDDTIGSKSFSRLKFIVLK